MATSPLFGWEEPDDTDLVKDGAAAIRTLGNAIDTSMGDLLGGTTGQILAKTSNTNMDFTWIANDVGDITAVTAGTGISGGGTSGAVTITNSMATEITAKGDVIVGTGSATFDNLAVGANGTTLVADSTTATGLRYQDPVNANPVLNSAFQVWQRGTSIAQTAAALYTSDRWQGYQGTATAITYTRQLTSDTTNLPFIQYCVRVQRNSGSTSTSQAQFAQSIETINSIPFAGKTITVSFYARKGANYSRTSNILTFGLTTGTGTDQNFFTGFTGASTAYTDFTLTGTWQRFTYTATIPTNATQIGLTYFFTPTGTAGAADYYEVTGVMLEVGSVATPFKTNQPTIATELAACQRYYFRFGGTGATFGVGMSTTTTTYSVFVQTPVPMRITPTIIEFSNIRITDNENYALAISTATINKANINGIIVAGGNTSGATANRTAFIDVSSAAGYLGFGAEL